MKHESAEWVTIVTTRSSHLNLNPLDCRDTVVGTPYWMSPEILSKKKYNYKVSGGCMGVDIRGRRSSEIAYFE